MTPEPTTVATTDHHVVLHGKRIHDEFAWMDRDEQALLEHLALENAYTEAMTVDNAGLEERLVEEFASRTQQSDLTVPTLNGRYWYYTRSIEGANHAIYCRAPAVDEWTLPVPDSDGTVPGEEVLLDGNAMVGPHGNFAVGAFKVSPDETLLAYSVDGVGDDRHTLRIRDLTTGEDLDEVLEGAYFTCAWYPDGKHLLHVRVDAKGRPHQVRRHALGTPPEADEVLWDEPDERFWVLVAATRSQRYMTIRLSSETESEVRLLDIDPAATESFPVRPRQSGVHYYVEHQTAPDGGAGRLLVHHTEGAPGRTVDQYDLDSGTWSRFLDADADDQITWVTAFERHVVVNFKRVMTSSMWVFDRDGVRREVEFPGELYNALPASNPRYRTPELRMFHSSPTTPDGVYSLNMDTMEKTLLRERPVLPDPDGRAFDANDYRAEREWAVAEDGTRIPITVVSRADLPRDGSAPCVLYGYGAYDRSADMGFSINRLSLLDRGFSYAVAHVRGGGELGSWWHDQGRHLRKRTSITDFLACARHLVTQGWTSHDRVFARGSSAGGLLVAAAVNADPAAFGGVIARVPFVDPLASMLDDDEPLTVTERDEWGDPAVPEEFEALLSFSPYHNVEARTYPPILAMASRNDTRVRHQQAAKWIARLRARASGGPFLLWTDMASGHRGRTGRYDAWRAEARVTAWLIQQATAVTAPRG